MPNLNKVFLMGNLTRDPELRVTPKGVSICTFSLAINREYRTGDGGTEKQQETIFIDVEAWGKYGETIAKYCAKGKPLYVEGRLRLDTWEDKNTKEKRSRMKVVLEQFQLLGGKDGAGTPPAQENTELPPPASRPTPPPPQRQAQSQLDEDVPF